MKLSRKAIKLDILTGRQIEVFIPPCTIEKYIEILKHINDPEYVFTTKEVYYPKDEEYERVMKALLDSLK